MITIKSKKSLLDIIDYYLPEIISEGVFITPTVGDDVHHIKGAKKTFLSQTKLSTVKNKVVFYLQLPNGDSIDKEFSLDHASQLTSLNMSKKIARPFLQEILVEVLDIFDCLKDTPVSASADVKYKKLKIGSFKKQNKPMFNMFGEEIGFDPASAEGSFSVDFVKSPSNNEKSVVKLCEASFLYQKTRGTNSSSIYKVIAIGSKIAVSARYCDDSKLSLRIEPLQGKCTSKTFMNIISSNFEGFDKKDGSYASVHVTAKLIDVKRIVASVVASVPDLKTEYPEYEKFSQIYHHE